MDGKIALLSLVEAWESLTEQQVAFLPLRIEGIGQVTLFPLSREELMIRQRTEEIWYCEYCTRANIESAIETGEYEQFAYVAYHCQNEEE